MVTASWRCCNIAILPFHAKRGRRVCRNFGNTFPTLVVSAFSRERILKCIHDGAISRPFLLQMDFSLTRGLY